MNEDTGTYSLQDAEEDIANLQNQLSVAADQESPTITTALIVGYATPNPRGPYTESFETGIGSFAGTNCTPTQSTTWASKGTHSLQLNANGLGDPYAVGPLVKCSPSDPVTLTMDLHCGATALTNMYIGIRFYDEGGVLLSETDSPDQSFTANSTVTGIQIAATSPTDTGWYAVTLGDHEVDASGTLLYGDNINVMGNVVYSVAASQTTDSVGNPIPPGVWMNGGMVLEYGGTGFNLVELTGAGNWPCPSGVTSVTACIYGASGIGDSNVSFACAGGGGGEYAQDVVGVTPGNNYAYSCDIAGNLSNSVFNGNAGAQVIAWTGGNAVQNTSVGQGGTGSVNSVHHDGGAGSLPVGPDGGGGGGGGGPSGPGGAATGFEGGLGGNGALILGPGGIGGYGGLGAGQAGKTGQAPNGAGGGAGANANAGAGQNGTIFLFWISAGNKTPLVNSMSPNATTDPVTGQSVLQGIWNYNASFATRAGLSNGAVQMASVPGNSTIVDGGGLPQINGSQDTISYDSARMSQVTTTTLLINTVNTAYQNVNPSTGPGLNVPLGKGQYIVEFNFKYTEAAAGTPRFQFTGPAFSLLAIEAFWQGNAVTTSWGGTQSGSYGPVAGPVMASGTQMVRIRVKVTTTASGTLQLQANTSASGDNYTVLVGADINVYPIVGSNP